jgi:hypothetical protein
MSAIRDAIVTSYHGGISGSQPSGDNDKRVTWTNDGGNPGIKLEGWVHQGVYRFWLSGLRKWIGGGIRKKAVDK